MKVLLLTMLLLGVVVAKDITRDKKLVKMLRNLLQKKQQGRDLGSGLGSGSGMYPPQGNIDTTLFNGIDAAPFKIFDDYTDLTEPLDISEIGPVKRRFGRAMVAIDRIGNEIAFNFTRYANNQTAPKNLRAVAGFIFNNTFPAMEEDEACLEPVSGNMFVGLIKGAIAGTTGEPEEPNEPGCDFDGDEDELVECVVNKVFLAMIASEIALEESYYIMTADIDGEYLEPCDQLYTYLEYGQELDGQTIIEKLAGLAECTRNNIQLVRSRLLERQEGLPPPPKQMLPKILAASTAVQHVGGQVWWFIYNLQELLMRIGNAPMQEQIRGMKAFNNKFLRNKTHKRFSN